MKTQGTHLFIMDPDAEAPAIVKFKCPTAITGITAGARSSIDTTCLDATDSSSMEAGLATPGATSIPFIFDPDNGGHQAIFGLKARGETVRWLVALSDGIASPTITAGEMVPPTDRTSFEFSAFIADLDIPIDANEVVRGTLTLQRSGPVDVTFKNPVVPPVI